ncbi:MAG: NADH-quinone oxidoreductase subunit L [Actinobacteria bacterium]|nr:NADH-quinone oxidoreductase subunit L [Actinomycetota bacterium]
MHEEAVHATSWILEQAWIVPVVPALSFLAILSFGKRLPKGGAEIGIPAVGFTFVFAVAAAYEWISGSAVVERSVTWFSLSSLGGPLDIEAGIHVDGLTVMMLVVVSTVSMLVHVYSVEYVRGDERFTYYFAALSLFTASMMNLVVADNLLQLLVGWELVGLCSFMLIGHWWEDRANSNAALKAFLTTRVGDVGLIIGIIVLFFAVGTFNIAAINHAALTEGVRHGLLLLAAVMLLLGVAGKSAQFPLHVWLPDAMAGPTPVSALIHAATMVVAGVYLVARVYGVFWSGFSIEAGGINLLALAGGVTLFIAAALAFVQFDIKKVLAYSTVSQLGYMIAALGVGAWTAGVFHLFTHAFFKAMLFLGAGSVSHAAHHTFDMREMGGLRKFMPRTYATWIIGTLALAGIPIFAGFFSKDEILLGASEGNYTAILILGAVGAFMTAAYMGRATYLTFFGDYRGHGHPHESPPLMTVPLLILAVPSVLIGLINAPGIERFNEWVVFDVPGTGFHLEHHDFQIGLALVSVAIAVAGLGVATWVYLLRSAPKGLLERQPIKSLHTFLVEKYYLDHVAERGIAAGTAGPVARAVYWSNQRIIDGVVNGVGVTARRFLAPFTYDVVDQKGVDGAYNGLAALTSGLGGVLRKVQSGLVQRYALLLFAAVGAGGIALALLV